MCDELGNDEHMQNYVMDAGSTSLCSTETLVGCSDKEKKFIETFKTKSAEDVQKQIDRLTGMAAKPMKEDLKKWLSQRLAILKQFKKAHGGSNKEEL
jgi:hypothetical protein|mmetsp:Transcript_4086/g.7894  ORF Transcript_4086/g.7894 Transcript_4086/m.7894 type:complete len:97 (-) Transcript_4086:401-691(-)